MKNKLLKLLLFLLAITIPYNLSPITFDKAHAQNISLSAKPSLIEIKTLPPEKGKVPITLQNESAQPVEIQVNFIPFRPTGESGQVELLSDEDIPEAFNNFIQNLSLTDNGIETSGFSLGPGQTKDLLLQYDFPQISHPADFYFSIVFNATPDISTSQDSLINNEAGLINEDESASAARSYLSAGIAVNVLFSIGDTLKTAKILNFSAPAFVQSGPVDFNIRLENTSLQRIKPIGSIYITNMFGQTIGKVELNESNILAGSARNLVDTQSAAAFSQNCQETPARNALQNDAGGSTVNCQLSNKAVWPEKLLIGLYSARLTFAPDLRSPPYEKTIYFFAMPVPIILGTIIFITLITAIIFRLKSRLKKHKK